MANRAKGGREQQGQRRDMPRREGQGKGSMTVTEAGQMGGERERELVKEGHREEEKPRR